jgi:hypothetical protein
MTLGLKVTRASADRRVGKEYCLVTFLLFLASVGVLEYLLRDVRQKSGGAPQSRATKDLAEYFANDASTAGLLSLGRALDAQKNDTATDSEHLPKAVSGGG